METTNLCNVNDLESDVLLPPRKRLLAGFKTQISDGNGSLSPPAVASSSTALLDVQTHLENLLAPRLSDPTLTPEEIAGASRSAAIAAEKAAKIARAVADEKAEIAAKAVASARTTLALVAVISQEAVSMERCSKKNKLKKQRHYSKDEKPRESHGEMEN